MANPTVHPIVHPGIAARLGDPIVHLIVHPIVHPVVTPPGNPTVAAAAAHARSSAGSGRVEAFGIGDLNPITWLGKGAAAIAGDAWKSAMIGLWSASLWLLQLAFKIIDVFTSPDLSATGPMASVLPTTLWIGATLAGLMMLVQLTVALVRRDGQSLARVLLGLLQFGFVWMAYLAIAAGLVAASAGLTRGILQAMLNVDSMGQVDLSTSWPRDIEDTTVATVLGVLSMLIVIPAAFFYILIMFVREAALVILTATAPISAGGLVNDTTKVWFWKTLRWFIACLLIAPTAALVLGIGVKLSAGVISGQGDQTAAAAGMAVVGTIVIAIGACCPLVLFRLLAFVEPGTASGAALRQSWSDAGGASGLLTGSGGDSAGSSAATQSGSDGRSGGESGAESQTQSRLAGLMGGFGSGMQTATSMAHRAADLGSDILGQAGVGSPGYSMTPTDERSRHNSSGGNSSGGDVDEGGGGGPGGGGPAPDSAPPTAPPGGSPGAPGLPGSHGVPGPAGPGGPVGPGGAAGGSGAAGAGAAGGSEAAIAVVAV
jgi:type IV secretion system protein TrbL